MTNQQILERLERLEKTLIGSLEKMKENSKRLDELEAIIADYC